MTTVALKIQGAGIDGPCVGTSVGWVNFNFLKNLTS